MNPESYSGRQNTSRESNAWGSLETDRRSELARRRAARESLDKYMEQDEPDHPWQKLVKRQLNPNLIGALSAVGFATLMTLDTVHNGPSSLVVNNPEIATTSLAAASAAIGGLAHKLVRDANAKELSDTHRREREQSAERRNQW